jgi:hypothetical protein
MKIKRIVWGLIASVFLCLFTVGILALSVDVKNAYAESQNGKGLFTYGVTPIFQFNDLSVL